MDVLRNCCLGRLEQGTKPEQMRNEQKFPALPPFSLSKAVISLSARILSSKLLSRGEFFKVTSCIDMDCDMLYAGGFIICNQCVNINAWRLQQGKKGMLPLKREIKQ